MPWSDKFDDAIEIEGGGRLVTLMDAANYIQALTKAEQQKAHWQLAISILIDCAERRDLTLHASIAVRRALNAGKPAPSPPTSPKRKIKRLTIVR